MKYPVFYSSSTGNTGLLAKALSDHLEGTLISTEEALSKAPSQTVDSLPQIVFVGFWTDKGSCDTDTLNLLSTLHGKQILIFGTAGFGQSESYFSQILSRASAVIPSDSQFLSGFMCQGRMPSSVRSRYESLLGAAGSDEERARLSALIQNFDSALSHPDSSDLQSLLSWADSQLPAVSKEIC